MNKYTSLMVAAAFAAVAASPVAMAQAPKRDGSGAGVANKAAEGPPGKGAAIGPRDGSKSGIAEAKKDGTGAGKGNKAPAAGKGAGPKDGSGAGVGNKPGAK